jgi:hypothetical protein
MKSIAYILSFVILSMAVTPCSDAFHTTHQDLSSSITITSIGEEHSHHHEKDDCDALCSCECCGTSVIIPQITSFDVVKIYTNYSYSFHYVANYSFDFLKGIWHPPAIC